MTDYERHETLLTALEDAIGLVITVAEIKSIGGMKGLELRRKLKSLKQVADYERDRLNEECEVGK